MAAQIPRAPAAGQEARGAAGPAAEPSEAPEPSEPPAAQADALPPLGPRLRALADWVLPGEAVADLCCDHGYLALSLVAEGRVPRAIAGDLNPGPLAGAAATRDRLGLGQRVALRLGDGAEILAPGEVATITVAGVGAPLCGELIARAQAGGHLEGARRLVLQANDGFPRLGELRVRLVGLGWGLVHEQLALEAGRLYTILVLERGGVLELDARTRELGPLLSRGEDPLWRRWLTHERSRTAAALAGMARARGEASRLGRARWRAWLEHLDAALQGWNSR
ncbi:tRNA (adenine(22)-N(1))-methyltransferase TrmK [Pseudenhygromyxa sp. WMMC2535]|uniref:tRNA (adenine(22)-N(1))-methyltransferase TrmK n=1 Tax=Pseudenhygromyxa sp. WMMC2535 TaxID=2712867 RepID=UPI001554C399|nr:tRNA (adenine(22)-N(1))-methyltransferase TrmK [Pseudenhygromyxa sp. WMMC2535]